MTVSTTDSIKKFTGNASTTVFAFPYKILDGAHFVVTLRNTSTLVVTTQTKDGGGTYDYTVSVAADKESADITFTTAPLAAHKIAITRVTTKTQATDYTTNLLARAAAVLVIVTPPTSLLLLLNRIALE